jgi:phage regulator Rha-like protein
VSVGRGGKPALIVSESGLYKVLMRSDKPEAKAFQDWVTRDVLPAIRKDGAYVMGDMTNALTTFNTNTAITMTSREIAELTGKRHADVLRDTRKMLDDQGINERSFASVYTDIKGESRACYFLPKDLTITLVSGYNVQIRYAITKRWMELEEATKPAALPTTFAEALRLAAELEEQKETLRLQNEAMKPAAQVGTVVGKRKNITVVDFAGRLPGVNKSQVQNRLRELK